MFVPAHNERLLNSAARSEADVLLLDLEDSVQPAENKQIARDCIKQCVQNGKFNQLLFPRINDRESGHLLKDLMQLTIPGIHGFMYPKSENGQDVYFVDKLLETIEYEKGFPIGTFKLIPLIETTSAVVEAKNICQSSERVIAIAFGCEDFVSDMEGVHDLQGQSLFFARSQISIAARATGVAPIDTVHIRVHDLEDLEKNLIVSKNLGFEGMLILHPKELPLAHQYYSPSLEEVQEAQEMLQLANQAYAEGKGVAVKNNKFIGPPMVIMANNILSKDSLIKKVCSQKEEKSLL